MHQIANKPLAESERKLMLLLMEIRGTATAERVRLYVAKLAGGRKLSEYIADETVPVKERAGLASALIEILLKKDYSRLPELERMENGNSPAPTASLVPIEALRPIAPIETPEPDDEFPTREDIRELIRAEVRRELANIFDIAARVLRETK